MYNVPKKIIFLIGLITILIFGVFAFFSTSAINVTVGGGVWFFFFLAFLIIFILSIYFLATWKVHPRLKIFFIVLILLLSGTCIYLAITYKPFDASNWNLMLGLDPILDPSKIPPPLTYTGVDPKPDLNLEEYLPSAINQGNCSICWAVGAAQVMHAMLRLNGTPSIDNKFNIGCNSGMNWLISPQSLIDLTGCGCECSSNPLRPDVTGSPLFTGFNFAVQYALPTNACVPYYVNKCSSSCKEPLNVPNNTNTCTAKPSYYHTNCTTVETISGDALKRTKFKTVYSVSGEDNMIKNLTSKGPMLCQINTGSIDPKSKKYTASWTLVSKNSNTAFGFYGNYTSPNYIARPLYDPEPITGLPNHGVVVYGYGTSSSGLKYWLIRNSWGTSWGNGGNLRIERGINAWGIESLCGGILL